MRYAVASPGGRPAGMRAFAVRLETGAPHIQTTTAWKGAAMYAVPIEVAVSGVDRDAGLTALREQIVPAIKAMPAFESGTRLSGNDEGNGSC